MRVKRTLCFISGWAAVGAGVIGIAVPVWPTTPFMLLAAFAFYHSSPRWHRWLSNNRFFGWYIEKRGVPPRIKAVSITVLWTTLGVSAFLVDRWWVWALLGAVGVGVTVHLLCLKTFRGTPPRFTLVELLTAIGIIAILASLLLPALGRARQAALSAACRSNLRQLALANQLYSQDFDDFPVPYSTLDAVNAAGPVWLGMQKISGGGGHGQSGATAALLDLTDNPLLGPYYGEAYRAAVCPAVANRIADFANADSGGGYGYNAVWLGRTPLSGLTLDIRLSRVDSPSGAAAFGDNGRTVMHIYTFDPPQLTPYMYCVGKPEGMGADYTSGTTHARHGGKANLAWCDGHVSAETLASVNADELSRRELVGFLPDRAYRTLQ